MASEKSFPHHLQGLLKNARQISLYYVK